ncbi:hypothetical protein L1987_39304 [Smallanthus sonchifolius]|uniref:Uncharacterized protein n=1 Tax=Smallanthus sonchifolius TaxID=185202 RepID=A0ACB9HMC1_9ASTR|nr:hypothetical protein L1987_39304 [Smallanthus sonchifolius]
MTSEYAGRDSLLFLPNTSNRDFPSLLIVASDKMSEINESSKDINIVDNDPKEAVIRKKYGGLLPRKSPLISKDPLTGWLQFDLDPLFKPEISALPGWLPKWLTWTKIQIMPVQWHTLGLGLFASSIAVTHRKMALSNDVCRSRL